MKVVYVDLITSCFQRGCHGRDRRLDEYLLEAYYISAKTCYSVRKRLHSSRWSLSYAID